MSTRAELTMWTVYVRGLPPYPLSYQAWAYAVSADGVTRTNEHMVAPDVELIRAELTGRGLARIDRNVDDDPTIVETWL